MYLSVNRRRAARVVNLYDFLLKNHYNEFVMENGSLRLISDHSVSIAPDYTGYKDFGNGEKGNSVDFLTSFLGYSIL